MATAKACRLGSGLAPLAGDRMGWRGYGGYEIFNSGLRSLAGLISMARLAPRASSLEVGRTVVEE
jgi:hypothetical protein